jgi:hypothetical protein
MFKRLMYMLAAASFIFGGVPARGQDAGALLDLLVRKKIITDQEAEEVRADLTKEAAATSAGKWKLSTPITELELYGDIRLRYEYRGGQDGGNVDHQHDWIERERERYRLRLGLRGTLADDWFFGIRLETSASNRSTNVTFGGDSNNGPFSKNDDGVFVGQAYAGYKGFPDTTLTVGRMANPLVTTLMVWDPDINPEGLAEQWKHTFTFNLGGGGAEAAQSYGKEGKGVVATQEPFKLKLDLFANFGQFVYDDSSPSNPLGARKTSDGQLIPNTNAFLLAWQVGARLTLPKNIYFQAAPVLYNYTGNGKDFNTHFQGGDPNLTNAASLAQNQTGINSLLVLDVPMEIGWKIGELPMRIFGDFAVNFEADDRAAAAGHPGKGDQRYAYQVGLGVGQIKAKHDWEVDVWYQLSQQYALDPNLVDDDIFDGHLNMHGIGANARYALSDAVELRLGYNYGWRWDNSLGTGGTPIGIQINPISRYQWFVADLNVKF